MIGLLGLGLGLFALGGAAGAGLQRWPRQACGASGGLAVAGSMCVLGASCWQLIAHRADTVVFVGTLPIGRLAWGLDALSALFLLPTAVVTAATAIYGMSYLQTPHFARQAGTIWLAFHALVSTLVLVVTARDGLLFLLAWEGMSLASFFLIMSDYDRAAVRYAGWVYLVSTHFGTACLLVLFSLLANQSGSLEFSRCAAGGTSANLLFLLALIGFGTKAGIVPFHVWLPEAHPAAPSHVSAVMSGVMIKTGLYGLLRTLTMLESPPAWWGWTLVAMGIVSGLLGIVSALAQHDLKRLLAYSSVEHVGMITLGLGVGLLGVRYAVPEMAQLGFLGAMLHLLNHALMKSLLFLAAGAVQVGSGTLNMNRLGGLLRRMPRSGTAFLVGAAAICGLPPLNGLMGELLIFLGVLRGVVAGPSVPAEVRVLLCTVAAGGLALIGGLAAACFASAAGSVFLGAPRSREAAEAREVGRSMQFAVSLLAGLCCVMPLVAPIWPALLRHGLPAFGADTARWVAEGGLSIATTPLSWYATAAWSLLFFGLLLAVARRQLLRHREVCSATTWDCGYATSVPRGQYTASSFVSPLTIFFRMFLRPREEKVLPSGYFPHQARYCSAVSDLFLERFYRPVFRGVAWCAARARWLQQGRLQLYVLYIGVTVLVLLVWKLG